MYFAANLAFSKDLNKIKETDKKVSLPHHSPKKEDNKYNKYYGFRALKNKDNSNNSNNFSLRG